ncbi:MAG TPA: HD domain-containing protein [Chloroflexota bacterium]|nr:HD domain-containing protein [Chloroflexota bacterium]
MDRRSVTESDLLDLLSPPERELFWRLAPSDQRHSLAVMRYLRRRGVDDRVLLRAALVHDVGKASAPIHIWQRVVHVLARAWAPGIAAWLARSDDGWRHGFYALKHHERLGAEMLGQIGTEREVVHLVGRVVTVLDDRRRSLLDEADSSV